MFIRSKGEKEITKIGNSYENYEKTLNAQEELVEFNMVMLLELPNYFMFKFDYW